MELKPEMTSEEAVAALQALDADQFDQAGLHESADAILLAAVPPTVRQVYLELRDERAQWWAYA